jgi:hypothetical protein
MSDFKQKLEEALCKERQLSASTCKTYMSLLTSVQKKLSDNDLSISFYKNSKDDILEHIDTLEKPQTKKTLLSALFVLTGDNDYREKMLENVKVVNDHYKKQKTDPERLKNVKSFDEIKTIHNQFKNAYKNNPTNSNLMDLLISSVCSGAIDGLPPRRVLDYAVMKIKNYNRDTDNYYEKGKFYFNQFKTKGNKGKQEMEVPKEIVTLINKRKKTSTNDFLLENESSEPYTQSSLSKKIKKLFQGNSQDVLRSIYLSNLYKDLPALTFLQDTADKMAHSIDAALSFYVKKDKPI